MTQDDETLNMWALSKEKIIGHMSILKEAMNTVLELESIYAQLKSFVLTARWFVVHNHLY